MTIRCRVMVLNEKGEILVVRHEPQHTYWALPGGKLDPNETTKECIIREIYEEFGVTLKNPILKFVVENYEVDSMEFFFYEYTDSPDIYMDHKGRDHFELVGKKFVDIERDHITLLPDFLASRLKDLSNMTGVEYVFVGK